jgi:uncharacterized membrane protein
MNEIPTILTAAAEPMPTRLYNKHRIEALGDGIFAVAMTLLVIELKLPEHGTVHSNSELVNAVGQLLPKFIAWFISFFVLALFWLGHHRLFHYVRHVDGKLLALSLLQLGFVSLMPFASALSGEYGGAIFSQIFYAVVMACLSMTSLLMCSYTYYHHELTLTPMPRMIYQGARIRTIGLVIISIASVVIASYIPFAGNSAFMLMIVIGIAVRRMEARAAKNVQITLSSNPTNAATLS